MESNQPLGYMLGRSLRVYKNQFAAELKSRQAALTFEQCVILHLLSANDNVIQQDLAKHMQKDKSIIVRQINGLLEGHYVERLTNKEDKRKKNLRLTDAGYEILNEMKKIANEVTQKLLTGVKEKELEVFRTVMEKIQKNGLIEDELFRCDLMNKK